MLVYGFLAGAGSSFDSDPAAVDMLLAVAEAFAVVVAWAFQTLTFALWKKLTLVLFAAEAMTLRLPVFLDCCSWAEIAQNALVDRDIYLSFSCLFQDN